MTERLIYDWKKPNINQFQRAKLLKGYLITTGLSKRAFAEKFNISRSTIEDWLLWNNITPQDYTDLKKKGMMHLEIYKLLRTGKTNPNKLKKHYECTPLDYELEKMCNKLGKVNDSNLEVSIETKELAEKLITNCRRLIFKIEKKENKNRG